MNKRSFCCWLPSAIAFCLLATALPLPAADADAPDDFELKRQALNAKPRLVIYDNDGNDSYLYPPNMEFSIENFLNLRTTTLKGSAVTTIAYCTLSSGFGMFTHRTKVGEFVTHRHGRTDRLDRARSQPAARRDRRQRSCRAALARGDAAGCR